MPRAEPETVRTSTRPLQLTCGCTLIVQQRFTLTGCQGTGGGSRLVCFDETWYRKQSEACAAKHAVEVKIEEVVVVRAGA